MRAISLKLLNNSQQMADRPREPVESDYDQRFTGADLAQQACQDRPGSIGARRVFLHYRFAARGAKLVELRIGALLLRGDTRVADQSAGEGGFPGFSRQFVNRSSLGFGFYNSTGYP